MTELPVVSRGKMDRATKATHFVWGFYYRREPPRANSRQTLAYVPSGGTTRGSIMFKTREAAYPRKKRLAG